MIIPGNLYLCYVQIEQGYEWLLCIWEKGDWVLTEPKYTSFKVVRMYHVRDLLQARHFLTMQDFSVKTLKDQLKKCQVDKESLTDELYELRLKGRKNEKS